MSSKCSPAEPIPRYFSLFSMAVLHRIWIGNKLLQGDVCTLLYSPANHRPNQSRYVSRADLEEELVAISFEVEVVTQLPFDNYDMIGPPRVNKIIKYSNNRMFTVLHMDLINAVRSKFQYHTSDNM